jgi:hypothetical protein
MPRKQQWRAAPETPPERRELMGSLRVAGSTKPKASGALSRRRVLRGLGGIALALPIFDCMLNGNGDAYADETELPTRFGLWFWGNGVRLGNWLPTSVGANFTLPGDPTLGALVGVQEYVSVVSGLSVKTPRHAHHSGMATICTGGPHLKIDDVRDTIVSTFKYPSVDQIAANHFMEVAPTPYRSLEAAVTRFRGTDEGTTFQYLSHNGSAAGETNVNPSEESPHAFFNRLFGEGTAEPLINAARATVLDAVQDQIADLTKKLGKRDRSKLDQHLSSVRDLETRLSAPIADCTKPVDPGDFPDVDGNEQMAEKNVIMSDLMTLALACGLTRAFSIMFSTCGSGAVYWNVGATDGRHYLNHTEPAPWDKGHAAAKFDMESLAYFLGKMRDTTEGDKNLLEQSSILCVTEHTEGWTHSQDDMPILVCGKGGGRLKGNVHYRQEGGNTTRALLTALRGAGLPLTEFGYEGGHVTDPISELEV